jgi:RsiW-degrading membrane proteinase PrsW (M82 family)
MEHRALWLFAIIGGGTLVLLGCGGGLLVLAFLLASESALTAVETLPLAGVIGLGLGFGLVLMLHGRSGWRARPSRPFNPPRVWLMWLAWMLLVGIGAVVSLLPLTPAVFLPPAHVLTMSLPPLIMLWSAGRALQGAGGSWREVVTVMIGGGSLGLVFSLVSEALVGLAFAVFLTAATLMTPGGEEQIVTLVNNLRDPAWLADFTNLAELLLTPTIATSVLGLLSVPVPLIEETFKTLAAGVAARWVRPRPARAFLWGVAGGAGFALVENVFNGALGGAEGWAAGAIARCGATMMHCAIGGLVGWGWGQLWAERRPLRFLGSYVAAVVLHGIWNAATVSATLLSVSALTQRGGDIWRSVAGLGMLTGLGLLGLLTLAFVFAVPFAGRKLAAEARQPKDIAVDFEETPTFDADARSCLTHQT